MSTQTFTGTLKIVTCFQCGMRYGGDSQWMQDKIDAHGSTYCPAGHSQWYPGQSDKERAEAAAKRAQELLESERRHNQELRESCNAKDRRIAATKGHLTRIKNRVGAGVCPCCNRTFAQLAAHMKTQHPDYRKAEA